jgi:DNA damage-binding protein 1
MEDELEETEIEGFDAQTQTLFCQNAINDLLIQVPFLITASFIFVAFLVSNTSMNLWGMEFEGTLFEMPE